MKARVAAETVLSVALAVAVIATAAVFGSDQRTESDPRASTWVDDRRGAHAVYLLLQGLGLRPERVAAPPAADAPTDRTHVLLAPSWPVTKSEAGALLDWTARGGRLVVVDAPSVPPQLTVDVSPILTPLGLETRPAGGREHGVKLAPGDWSRDVSDVRWPAKLVVAEKAGASREARAGAPETLASSAEGDLAVRIPFGDGEVVVVADEAILANDALGRADNALLAVRLLDAGGRRVVFDEFHHGFTPTGTRAALYARFAQMLVETWVGRALLLLAFAGAIHVLGAAVRLGAPLPEPVPPRRALREHADALGRLLEGARASREVLLVLVSGARRSVASRIGLGPRTSVAELRAALDRSLAPGARELAAAVGEAADAAAGTRAGSRAGSHAGSRPGDARAGGARMNETEFARLAANLATARRRFLRGGSER